MNQVIDFTIVANEDSQAMQSLASVLQAAASTEASLLQQSTDFRNSMVRLTEPTIERLRARAHQLRLVADQLDNTANNLSHRLDEAEEAVTALSHNEEDGRAAYRMAEIKSP